MRISPIPGLSRSRKSDGLRGDEVTDGGWQDLPWAETADKEDEGEGAALDPAQESAWRRFLEWIVSEEEPLDDMSEDKIKMYYTILVNSSPS